MSWKVMTVAVLGLGVAACSSADATAPDTENSNLLGVSISGAEQRKFDGTSVFHLGSNRFDGTLEFTLGMQGKGATDRDFILIYGATALPPVGTHRIGLSGTPYKAFNSRGAPIGPGLVAYAAYDGELVITYSSPNLLQGSFRYNAFRYCNITETNPEGPCSIPSAPIAGAPRVEVSGTFSALPHDQLPIDTVTVPGVIDFYHDAVVIEVPSSVDRGTPINILVRTYGGGCTTKARTDVKVEGRTVTVEPYDTEIRGVACTSILRTFDHTAQVTFNSPGAVNVVIRGGQQPEDKVITFQRTVQVR